MCNKQSLCWSLEYSINIKLLTEHHLEFLSLREGCTGSLSLHMSKYHIVGNHMSRLIYIHPHDPQLDSAVVVVVGGGGTAVEYVNDVPVVISCGVVVVCVVVVVSVVVVVVPAAVVVVPAAVVVVGSVVVVEAPGIK